MVLVLVMRDANFIKLTLNKKTKTKTKKNFLHSPEMVCTSARSDLTPMTLPCPIRVQIWITYQNQTS